MNEQERQNKQNLIGKEHGMVVTRRKGTRVVKIKGIKHMVTDGDLTLIHMMYYRIAHLRPL